MKFQIHTHSTRTERTYRGKFTLDFTTLSRYLVPTLVLQGSPITHVLHPSAPPFSSSVCVYSAQMKDLGGEFQGCNRLIAKLLPRHY